MIIVSDRRQWHRGETGGRGLDSRRRQPASPFPVPRRLVTRTSPRGESERESGAPWLLEREWMDCKQDQALRGQRNTGALFLETETTVNYWRHCLVWTSAATELLTRKCNIFWFSCVIFFGLLSFWIILHIFTKFITFFLNDHFSPYFADFRGVLWASVSECSFSKCIFITWVM